MTPWLTFFLVALSFFGLTMWSVAVGTSRRESASAPSEGRAWRRLLLPPLVGAPFLAFMAGWVAQESNPSDELVPRALAIPAGLVGLVVMRAGLRATRSALRKSSDLPIATVGLLRPRVVVSEEFRAAANPSVLSAALAHEEAHRRARDPLRIWGARFVTDLQWPLSGARARLERWHLGLELRRDDEAIRAGASPTALAEGLLIAAELIRSESLGGAAAAMTGDGGGLALRVRRLLSNEAGARDGGREGTWWGSWAVILGAFALLGAAYGDAFLLLLPGASR